MLYFNKLILSEWQQFEKIDIDFHNRLTILTGANGSGKTTLLNNILAKHCGWNVPLGSTPMKDKTTGIMKYFPSFASYLLGGDQNGQVKIGSIIYSNGESGDLLVPKVIENNPQYQISISKQQPVECMFVSSQRSVFSHRTLENMPTRKKNKQQLFNEFSSSSRERYIGNNINQPISLMIKGALISWAYQGYGNEKIQPDEEQKQMFEAFEGVLRKILPESLKFEELKIVQNMDLVLSCNGGRNDYLFEQSSGGISALIDIAWQIHTFNTKEHKNFTVIIDEVENHLHPVMQRRILPDLLEAFPQVNFIISTHSPLVVSSVKDSYVYALRYNDKGMVESERIDLVNEAKTANEILDEILGVSFSMPIWAEKALGEILDKYKKIDSPEKLKDMRSELQKNGLEKIMPVAIDEIYK